MADYSLRDLEYWDAKIREKVEEFGLDTFPQEFELCDRNPEALATALETMLGDSARRTSLGAAGRAWVVEHLPLDLSVRRHVELYETGPRRHMLSHRGRLTFDEVPSFRRAGNVPPTDRLYTFRNRRS